MGDTKNVCGQMWRAECKHGVRLIVDKIKALGNFNAGKSLVISFKV